MAKPRKSPGGGKRARTRAALVEAAAKIVGEKGFEKTSLEEVAARAKMTRGAIYGNFRDRESLFLAVAETFWQPVRPPITPGASFRQQMQELAKVFIADLPNRSARAAGAASFQHFALSNKKLRRQVAKANAAIYRDTAQHMRQTARLDELPAPPETMVRLLHALIDGLTFLHALTPELVDEDTIVKAFTALAVKSGA